MHFEANLQKLAKVDKFSRKRKLDNLLKNSQIAELVV